MATLYEILTIINPDETDDGVDAIIGGLRQALTQSGGEVLAVDKWGRRKLAYPIRKKEEGIYALLHVEGPPNLAADFRAHTRIRESIMRELIVKLEDAHEAVVRKQLEESGPEDAEAAAAQIAAAGQRAAEKRAAAAMTAAEAAAAEAEVVIESAAPSDDGIQAVDSSAPDESADEAVVAEAVAEPAAAWVDGIESVDSSAPEEPFAPPEAEIGAETAGAPVVSDEAVTDADIVTDAEPGAAGETAEPAAADADKED